MTHLDRERLAVLVGDIEAALSRMDQVHGIIREDLDDLRAFTGAVRRIEEEQR